MKAMCNRQSAANIIFLSQGFIDWEFSKSCIGHEHWYYINHNVQHTMSCMYTIINYIRQFNTLFPYAYTENKINGIFKENSVSIIAIILK